MKSFGPYFAIKEVYADRILNAKKLYIFWFTNKEHTMTSIGLYLTHLMLVLPSYINQSIDFCHAGSLSFESSKQLKNIENRFFPNEM